MIGFNSAVSGLLASQRAIYVTNHNIDNANTEGYSRQEALQRATSPMYLPGIGFLGTGTEIYDIIRHRDSYIDFKYWNENAPTGEWNVKRETLVELENLFGEPSDSSFRKYMDEFFSSLEDLSKNPSDYSYRAAVREKAKALTMHIRETAERLDNLMEETDFSISTKVNQINNIADQIKNLNEQIYSLELDGTKANDLRDRRELLVDQLSEIINVQVSESDDGKFRVGIGGMALVDHIYVNELKYEAKDSSKPDEKEVMWENGNSLKFKSGELKGLIDVLYSDGEESTYRGIPFYKEKLNTFARQLISKVNDVHRNGYGLNGSYEKEFFTGEDANTISLSDAILDNLDNIAAAYVEKGEFNGEAENNKNLLKLIALRENKKFFEGGNSQGTPDDFIKSILSNLSVDSQQASRMSDTQGLIMDNIVQKRDSESGVELNEEMTNMIKYQHSYNAAARMITTIDAILNVTINGMGLVGR